MKHILSTNYIIIYPEYCRLKKKVHVDRDSTSLKKRIKEELYPAHKHKYGYASYFSVRLHNKR